MGEHEMWSDYGALSYMRWQKACRKGGRACESDESMMRQWDSLIGATLWTKASMG